MNSSNEVPNREVVESRALNGQCPICKAFIRDNKTPIREVKYNVTRVYICDSHAERVI